MSTEFWPKMFESFDRAVQAELRHMNSDWMSTRDRRENAEFIRNKICNMVMWSKTVRIR